MSREGFWRVVYGGKAGEGFAVVVFDSGLVVGAGVGGAIFDGTYAYSAEASGLSFEVTGTATVGGIHLVQGGPPLIAGEKFTLRGVLKQGHNRLQLHSDRGPVDAWLEKIRDFPAGA